jgi:hypothetical protein
MWRAIGRFRCIADALPATLYGHSTRRPLSRAERCFFARNSLWALHPGDIPESACIVSVVPGVGPTQHREFVSAALRGRAHREPGHPRRHGRAVQVDSIKPMLKAPGTKRLNWNMMKCFQTLLSNSTCAATPCCSPSPCCCSTRSTCACSRQGLTIVPTSAQLELTLPLCAQLKLTLSPI